MFNWLLGVILGVLAVGSLGWGCETPYQLTVRQGGEIVRRLEREQLATEFPQHVLNTDTPWTEGIQRFSGPTLKSLLDGLNVVIGERIWVKAFNDYSIFIPKTDLNNYPIILALKRQEKWLSGRELGPLWVVYPWTDFPSLHVDLYYARSVWQTCEIVVE